MKAIIAIALLTSCAGQVGEMEEGAEGKSTFNSEVAPALRSQCAACHEAGGSGPPFMGTNGPTDDYTALLANSRIVGGFQPGAALLLTKGPHAGARWWDAEQIKSITDWLIEESEDFGPGGAVDILAAWAGCMTIA